MTEKRFEMVITGADGSFHYLDKNTGEKITSTLELENKLNEQHETIEQLKSALKELKEIGDYQADRIQELNNENEQLKQRNDRQAKRLDNLYHLIEKQDWKTLKGLIQEFQECEEQLQREWECYE